MPVVPTPTTTRVADLVFRVQGLGTILQEAHDSHRVLYCFGWGWVTKILLLLGVFVFG